MPTPSLRLNKFLAERLGISRRSADELIKNGKIIVDKTPGKIGQVITPKNQVFYKNKLIPFETNFTYLALHKPVGYVCSRRAQGENSRTLYELLPKELHFLKTVGRLDQNSSGLILLTDDGDFAFKMTHPKFQKIKIYEVFLDHPLEPFHRQLISDFGINLPDGPSQFTLERLPKDSALFNLEQVQLPEEFQEKAWRIIMSEGRNRQIRRTFAALGYTVEKLHRTSFGPYSLNNLKSGTYKFFKK